jgi:hypothetical protein
MRRWAALLATLILTVGYTSSVRPHPDDQWIAPQLALARWAEAVASHDRATIILATAEGSPPFESPDADYVITRYATFTPVPGGLRAGPVVVRIDDGTLEYALDVRLVEDDGAWKVAGVTPAAMPSALTRASVPEPASTRLVRFKLFDADGDEAVFARVHITDESGTYWPPQGHERSVRTGWRQNVGGDVVIAGKTYAYVPSEFSAELPAGKFRIEARKGTEYLPASKSFEVEVETMGKASIEVPLHRWIHMNERLWYAGDTHTHFLDDRTALLEQRAEDVNMVYVLATKWGELITDVNGFTGAPSTASLPSNIVVVNEETRHGWLGHAILHGITELVYPLSWGGPPEGIAGGIDYPPMAHQADRAHAQGGLVTWAHFPNPGGELAVDVALGKIDSVDLFTWGDPFSPTDPRYPSAVETWYQFLNTGARLPATAGTDKMLNVQVLGSVRTYVQSNGPFSYEAWLQAIKSGRSFVTTGPVIALTANDSPIGSELNLKGGQRVAIRATVEAPYELYPIDTLEIIVGGEVLASKRNDGSESALALELELVPTESTWIAARARGTKLMPYQAWALLGTNGIQPMAHTSPIYVSLDGGSVWSEEAARALERRVDAAIEWAKSTGKFSNEAQRAEVIALYEQAKAIYRAK